MKKVLKMFLVGLLIFSFAAGNSLVYGQESNNAVISDKDLVISKLLNAGWSMQQINDLPDSELMTYKDGQVVSHDTRYYRLSSQKKEVEVADEKTKKKKTVLVPIEGTSKTTELSEEQCMAEVQLWNESHNELQNSNDISTMSSSVSNINLTPMSYDNGNASSTDADGWIKVDIYATYISGSKYKLTGFWTWLTTPGYRLTDVFGLGHDSGLIHTNDAVFAYYSASRKYYVGWDSESPAYYDTYYTESYSNLAVDDGGDCVSFNLMDDTNLGANDSYYTSHRGGMSYYVNVNGTATRYTMVYGKYAHQKWAWNVSPSISWPLSVGFSVSPSSYFDYLSPNPYFQLHVNY